MAERAPLLATPCATLASSRGPMSGDSRTSSRVRRVRDSSASGSRAPPLAVVRRESPEAVPRRARVDVIDAVAPLVARREARRGIRLADVTRQKTRRHATVVRLTRLLGLGGRLRRLRRRDVRALRQRAKALASPSSRACASSRGGRRPTRTRPQRQSQPRPPRRPSSPRRSTSEATTRARRKSAREPSWSGRIVPETAADSDRSAVRWRVARRNVFSRAVIITRRVVTWTSATWSMNASRWASSRESSPLAPLPRPTDPSLSSFSFVVSSRATPFLASSCGSTGHPPFARVPSRESRGDLRARPLLRMEPRLHLDRRPTPGGAVTAAVETRVCPV